MKPHFSAVLKAAFCSLLILLPIIGLVANGETREPLSLINVANNFTVSLSSEGYKMYGVNNSIVQLQIDSLSGFSSVDLMKPESFVTKSSGDKTHFINPNFTFEYINSKEGLRQNFIIENRGANKDELLIYLTFNFNGEIKFDKHNGLTFLQNEQSIYTYTDLKVWDETKDVLPAYFELISNKTNEAKIALHISLKKALFPIFIDPNMSLINGGFSSEQNSSRFGRSLSNAGDTNGDGYEDLLVGAFYYDNGQTNEGRAFLFHGGAEKDPSTAAWTYENDQASSQLGYEVKAGRDINNDGFSDMLVSANLYDNGQTDEGIVYMFLGSASGYATTASWTYESNNATANLGNSIDFAGDINNDGFEDVIVGAINFDMAVNEGKVFVFYGNASGLPAVPSWTKFGYASNRYMGTLVASAGDVNNDGFDDVAIVEKISTLTHRIYLFNGSAAGLNTTYSWSKDVLQKISDITVADLNYDNFDDIVIGCPDLNEGVIYCYSGGATGLSTVVSWTVHGNPGLGELGHAIAIGDVNNDGFLDLATNDCIDKGEVPFYMNPYNDEVKVFYGISTGIDTVNYYSVELYSRSYSFGHSLDFSDHNGDGFIDLVIGNPESSELTLFSGAVYYVNSSSIGLFAGSNSFFFADQEYAQFGQNLCSADVNGDGYSDVIIPAEGFTIDTVTGITIILYGGENLLHDFLTTPQSDSTWEYVNYGNFAFDLGDINADGFDDIGVGYRNYSNGETYEGTIFVYNGSAAGIVKTPAWQMEGNEPDEYLGDEVAGGDFNNDGFSDLVTKAHHADTAYAFYGSVTGLSTTPDWKYVIENTFELVNIGDFNGDGIDDLVGGIVGYNGPVYYFAGSPSGLPLTPSGIYYGPDENGSYAGDNVSNVGDINADGYNDFISTGYLYENGQSFEGMLYIFYGSPSGSIADPVLIESNVWDLKFGYLNAGAGDVNSDGFDDVLISTYDPIELRLYYGSPYGLDTSYYFSMRNSQTYLSGLGDINGDSFGDFGVANDLFRPYGSLYEAGSVLIYYGGINVPVENYCEQPNNIEIMAVTPGNVGIDWDNSPDINEFTIRWKKLGETVWIYDTITVSNKLITGLENCATYQYQIKTNCSPFESGWSPLSSFSSYCNLVCDSVTAIFTDSIDGANIYISWEGIEIGESYIVEYKKSTSPTWLVASSIVENFTITGALYCTNYQIRIRTVCSSDTSGYGPIYTATSECPPCYAAPSGLFVTNITSSSAKLHWNADPGAINYKIYYRITGTTSWTKKNSASNVKKITGLNPATNYDYKIKTECAAGFQSGFSPISNFTTLPLRDENVIDENQLTVAIYPNPSENDFSLMLESTSNQDLLIQITSMTGSIIYNETVTFEPVINIKTQLPAGIYNLTIVQENIQASNLLVIQ